MHCLVVGGARPNFVKIAPILAALDRRGHRGTFVHTGQHYDAQMSGALLADLALPTPDYHLNVGSATHAVQTARVMEAFEPVLMKERPDWVIVVGDVNLDCGMCVGNRKALPADPELAWLTLKLDCGVTTGECRRKSIASLQTGCRIYC